MPAVSARGSRRRTINEINMVPFIDVMLVLLIIFMVSAPLITTGLVDLPSVGKSRQQPEHVIHIIVGTDEKLRLKVDKEEPQAISMSRLARQVKQLQGDSTNTPVVISADRNVKYEAVVKVMDSLQSNGVTRVGLAVKNGDELLFASLYWRSRQGVNDYARVHHLTPVDQRSATVRQRSAGTTDETFTARDWILWDYAINDPGAGHLPPGGFPPPGDTLHQSQEGDVYHLAPIPDDIPDPTLGVHFDGVETDRLEHACDRPRRGAVGRRRRLREVIGVQTVQRLHGRVEGTAAAARQRERKGKELDQFGRRIDQPARGIELHQRRTRPVQAEDRFEPVIDGSLRSRVTRTFGIRAV